MEWLFVPIDPDRPHTITAVVSWHARLMTLAWGVLLPIGILITRYLKITPRQDWPRELDNPFWWRSHLWLHQTAVGLTLVAAGLILFWPPAFDIGRAHGVIGWLVVVCALLQVTSGYLRGSKGGPTAPAPDGSLAGDHYDMTPRRKVFELFHKSMGYLLLCAAAANILIGLWQVNAPVWMWIAIPGFWVVLLLGVVAAERRGFNTGSYQAIWGPDRVHPGNSDGEHRTEHPYVKG